jgi:hypothetical protein
MDPNFRIYMDDEEKIPAEDKARLDGYLKGREEAEDKERMDEIKVEYERLRAEMEAKP